MKIDFYYVCENMLLGNLLQFNTFFNRISNSNDTQSGGFFI